MRRLLDRYVGGYFLRLFTLFVLAAPLLFVLFDLTDNLDRHLELGLTVRQIALGYVYLFPTFVLWAFPVAALIATIFTVNSMTRHSEVAAAKASGISFWRLFVPLPLLGVLLTGGALALAELVPVTTRLRAEVMGEKTRVRGNRTNFAFQAEGGEVLVVQRLDANNGVIFKPRLEQEGDGETYPTTHAVAETAHYRPEQGGWVLEDGFLRMLYADAGERTLRFERLRARGLDQTPDELMAQPKEPDEMRYRELERFIGIIERAGADPRELRVDLAQKIAIPIATLIIILFAAPLATAAPRSGAAYGVGISLGITIVYLMLFRVAGALGVGGTLPPMAAAWLPNVIFLLAGLVLTTRVRT
ncbi:MAG TPA: LptF/LptG family permease [Longimicrobiales bacterium]|nr:LptF/LptG family permease [Longimicrobiales bacterium]